MAHARTEVKKLLTAQELELYDFGSSTEINKLTKPQLRTKLERSRKLRDKYRDLFRRQRLALRSEVGSKSGTKGNANDRTRQKEEIFAEVVARFESRILHIEEQEDKELQAVESAPKA
ncbi:hypothetical protein L1889_18255 [Paenalcaligenes niemegkensis]|uniref:hypothetical protein n=1 Tax=Paenalcaligenes niemegkensis TaxID=2895469 RepID=UPI001EE8BF3E|nr:hypothetical protein [Paenalcaligenes niemegkensis]MCQ9618383.1 hypothetical protein [Paenalcaligenes niemegkensis]